MSESYILDFYTQVKKLKRNAIKHEKYSTQN